MYIIACSITEVMDHAPKINNIYIYIYIYIYIQYVIIPDDVIMETEECQRKINLQNRINETLCVYLSGL